MAQQHNRLRGKPINNIKSKLLSPNHSLTKTPRRERQPKNAEDGGGKQRLRIPTRCPSDRQYRKGSFNLPTNNRVRMRSSERRMVVLSLLFSLGSRLPCQDRRRQWLNLVAKGRRGRVEEERPPAKSVLIIII